MQFKSKVDLIYEQIIDSIFDGTYKQGERIIISKIAKINKVSDIPVREALRRLESDGLVQIVANHGALITKYEPKDIMQMHMIIAVMGAYAAKLSADHLDENDFAELKKINEKIKQDVQKNDGKRFGELNQEFHLRMYGVIPLKMIYSLVNDTWNKWARIGNDPVFLYTKQNQAYDDHVVMLQLAKEKRYDQLEQFVRKHMTDSAHGFIL